jgi:hypothetical protein
LKNLIEPSIVGISLEIKILMKYDKTLLTELYSLKNGRGLMTGFYQYGNEIPEAIQRKLKGSCLTIKNFHPLKKIYYKWN